ncbi:AbrB/MazE/SpoVT family DNA-binding domain-containing protein [Leptospira bandrabouensis]|uniref:AbrB/MazE/SpoVT family DNA-binding domain-containing protein n=1 Tax=Leptospira bandrabouensis TaxID=2484903 RepID=A0A6H3NTB8_9LEPT|nr:AbrB/MazE/SpoVT family DNA-binding domain-containing protein [Leptospira bandrabouensis]MCG6143286.1 AbrB/MazE/SpoVT family DNA-binding domain-containing protein [Leptospira bandrabouensis]MCG6158946.1 AbrB/MazE/SpoVT family DNA-binding domain-containing protein [Leptospira bandrabouensis]MCG6162880.1 AbrB/MazE/SpoVT family DNA-binding domain-containing protein [Leptospira bandrabouensis]MCW7458276.1 AbrB/MazE/SpoVT family DNA-binding domain-containing protein [Leptospira bandrabouensis]MCW
MKAAVIQIGNSKGIRIPKTVLAECQIEGEVDLLVEDNKIIITPVKSKPRMGWEDQFKAMAKEKEDELLIPDSIDLNSQDWEW